MSAGLGYGAVQNAIARAQANRGPQVGYLGWDGKKSPDENRKIIRQLTDNVVTLRIHEYVVCSDGKKRDFVCAKSVPWNRQECFFCDNVKTEKGNPLPSRELTVGLAAVRMETHVEVNGKTKRRVTDKLYDRERKVEGKEETQTVKEPYIGVVKQAIGNFWTNFHAYYAMNGTTIDRDFIVSRVGNDRNTKYPTIPYDPIDRDLRVVKEDDEDETDVEKTYAKLMEHYGEFLPEGDADKALRAWVDRMSSPDRIQNVYFGSGESDDETAAASAEAGEPEPEAEPQHDTQFAQSRGSFADALLKYKKTAQGGEAESSDEGEKEPAAATTE